ncbi:uncharacterized protein EDB93DRAFT_1257531 [Suillus bovinus]|uniref:uncharacterized protein n=1 Tax=Suillus bovinus TaxID=48563 RepID=UPI001B870620|nr:uncharacterized protein EDB93DRAFT_1257531 [Suillus bovinus]KAG2126382.1 hypothetical protein EDB93DRAFT_1257531 [Suillus bovinus]
MCNTPKAVLPFYDPEPGAPLPFPPMLTDQIELFGKDYRRPTTLVADEILVPKVSIVTSTTTRASSTPTPEFKLAKRPLKHSDHGSPPYLKKVSFMCSHSRTPMPSDSEGSSDVFSDSDSLTSSINLSEDSKIPKPAGEPGRPGHGWYTLYEALDWNPKAFAKFKKCMHHLIDDHLDTSKCASAQSPMVLQTVCNKALDEFPDLKNYSNLWPVNNMMMTCLKYTSSHT